jgi:uncharacterized protein YuzE
MRKSDVKIEYDKSAKAVYIKTDNLNPVDATEAMSNEVLFDVDRFGGIVGIEILNIDSIEEI